MSRLVLFGCLLVSACGPKTVLSRHDDLGAIPPPSVPVASSTTTTTATVAPTPETATAPITSADAAVPTTVPKAARAPVPAEPQCTTTTGPSEAGPADDENAPITVQLCASHRRAAVGQVVRFRVQARDPDVRLYGLGRCLPDGIEFGDETARCRIANSCAGGLPPPAKEPGTLDRRFEHTYKEAGTFTVHVEFGDGCPGTYASPATVELTIEVV